jgi:hypothetical protein
VSISNALNAAHVKPVNDGLEALGVTEADVVKTAAEADRCLLVVCSGEARPARTDGELNGARAYAAMTRRAMPAGM